MEQLSAFFSSPTVRRLAVAGLTAGLITANKKFGLGLDTSDVAGLVALALGYLVQSAATDRARILAEAKAAGDAAADKVQSPEDAAKALEAKP